MKCIFKKGFTIYEKDDTNVLIAAPHSGPALETVTSRDDNSDTVASLCWKRVGGTLIISNISRKRIWGIDFNRDIPSLNLALSMYDEFVNAKDSNKLYEYRKKYAWVARDDPDYYNRLRIYQDFWSEISKKDNIILVHKAFSKIKSVPSIIDMTIFGREVKNELIKEVVEDVNVKYYDFLKKIENDYRASIVFETRRTVLNLLRIYKKFDLDVISAEYKENLQKDLVKIKQYADKIALNRLNRRFTPQHFVEAAENAVERIPTPRITVENNFNGVFALGPKNKLFPYKDKIILEVEPSAFINFWHPHIAAEIIVDAIKKLMSSK